MSSTPNGYDKRWVLAFNTVLRERDTNLKIKDINEEFWERFLATAADALERLEFPELLVAVPKEIYR